ncbi:DgyrCDS8423 [Dimorphilus gyrociliatus]|uniref:Vacuolar protein sorting-associated protein 72 homolog n=1 Tax=Dimorphilus gyrociliatus TaxID=2664684 RepID=A0A7I8VUC2_9ANNE|nr:DgyrCDS8423 [Dimorphilus gyrociliatus]
MSLARNRAKRSTAGNRLNKLLENEDPEKHKDEFYQTAYGGFAEETEDINYSSDSDADQDSDDSVDSDFDIDETDEIRSEEEEADKPEKGDKKKKKRDIIKDTKVLIEKAQLEYKNSLNKPMSEWTQEEIKRYHTIPIEIKKLENIKMISKIPENEQLDLEQIEEAVASGGRTILSGASSIAMKLIEAQRLEREKKKQEMQDIDPEKFIALQHTKMEEAKLNEYLNRKSLNAYRINEAEIHRAKRMLKKQNQPIVSTLVVNRNNKIDHFVTYHNPNDVKRLRSRPPPRPKICVITGQPAKYTDPLTGKPYYSLAALQQLRKLEKLPFKEPGKDIESYELELLKRKPKWFTKFHAKRLEQNNEMKEQLDIMNNFMKGHGLDLKKPNPSKAEINKFQDLIFNEDFLEAYSPAPVVHSLSQLGRYREGLSFNLLIKLIEKYKNLMKVTKSKTSILWEELLMDKNVDKYFKDNVMIKRNDFGSDTHPSVTKGLEEPSNDQDFVEEMEEETVEKVNIVNVPQSEVIISEVNNDSFPIEVNEDMKEFLHGLRGSSSSEEEEEEEEDDVKSEDNDLISNDEDMKDPDEEDDEEKDSEEQQHKKELEPKGAESKGKRRQSARLRKL